MGKCCQDNCYLDKCHHDILNLFIMVLGTYWDWDLAELGKKDSAIKNGVTGSFGLVIFGNTAF